MRPLLPSNTILPLFSPNSFSFSNNVNRFEATMPYFESESGSRGSPRQHDEKENIGGKVEIQSQGVCKQHNMDPRKLRRIISNRVSAQKSRMKKIQYVSEMEKKAKALEATIAVLRPQVVMYRNKQQLLEMEQKTLTQEISSRASKKLLNNEEIEENKAEVNRLRKLYLVQEGERMEEASNIQSMDVMMNSNLGEDGENEAEIREEDWKDEEVTDEEIWCEVLSGWH
ncbi:Basic leucine zipper 19 [Euphorbia peplus]|nr:Basic leucine zipper 19 [Euphorbia peplus]